MNSFYLSHLFIEQCDEILGALPSSKEKRELLLTLLLLHHLSSTPERWYLDTEGAMGPSLSRMWKICISSEEHFVKRDLIHMISSATRRLPALRSLLDPALALERVTDQQLKQLFDLFDRSLHQEMKQVEDGELLEALATRYPWEAPPGTSSFYAPRNVTELLVDLLQPEGGDLYDPCCGSANMLLPFAQRMSGRDTNLQIFGRESNPDAWKLANLNLLFHGFSADLGRSPSYAPTDLQAEQIKADYVVSNPPFNDGSWSDNYQALQDRSFLRYGSPPKKRGSLAWLQFMLYALKPGGKLATLLNISTLDSSYDRERKIRMGLVEDDLLEAVILLPAGLFGGTEIPVALLLLQNGKRSPLCRGHILMVDGSGLGVEHEKKVHLTQQDRQEILSAWEKYRQGRSPERSGFCTTVSVDDVAAQEGTLYPKYYIPYKKAMLPSWEALLEKESALQMELREQLRENAVLLQQICRK